MIMDMNIFPGDSPLYPRSRKRKGNNSESINQENRSLILQMIKESRVITRTKLAEQSGLRQATITIIMKEFLANGIVQEKGFIDGDNGRRVMGFGIAENRFSTFCVRLSRQYIAVGVYDIFFNCIKANKIFVDTYLNFESTLKTIYDEICKLKHLVEGTEILGIGVGVDGPFVFKDNKYLLSVQGKTLDIGTEISNMLSLPVIVNKISNFSAYYFWHEKEAVKNGNKILVNIMISYFLECSILINGEMLIGSIGLAGLFGRLPAPCNTPDGTPKTLDDYIAPQSILNRVYGMLDEYPDSILAAKKDSMRVNDVIDAYMKDDALATTVYNEAGRQLGAAISTVINLINPDIVIVGDEIPYSDKMTNAVREEIDRCLLPAVAETLDFSIHKLERKVENDIALIGASMYVTDVALTHYNTWKPKRT